MNEEINNRIEAFLAGGLSSAEREAFLAEIANDSQLAEIVAQHRLERELARQRPDFMEIIRRADAKVDVQQTGPSKKESGEAESDLGAAAGAKKGWRSKVWFLIIPLLFVACLVFWYWPETALEFKPTSPTLVDPPPQTPSDVHLEEEELPLNPTEEVKERTTTPPANSKPPTLPTATTPPIADAGTEQKYRQLALNLYEPYAPINLRGSAKQVTPTDSLALAKAAYEATDWPEVLRISPTGTSAALKLQAHAAFQSGEYSLAARLFAQLEQSDRFYRRTAQWFQLLSLAANGQSKTAAFNELLVTVTTSGHPYAEDAQAFKN